MILWFLDRFGMPGHRRALWARLMGQAQIPPIKVRFVSLHKEMRGTLLAKYGTRNAPSWVPERENEIRMTMQRLVEKHKPTLIVLSAPESLVATNVHPEHATLLKLRGSTYLFEDRVAVVTLPMSAWDSQVSTKELGNANYGDSDREAFDAHFGGGGPAGAGGGGAQQGESGLGQHGELGDFFDLTLDESGDYGFSGADSGGDSRSDSTPDPDDQDSFWYEPVVVPVGQFMLKADAMKIGRIYNGKGGEFFDAY